MPLNYKLVTGPAVEPVSVLQAKQQCRVDFPDDDTLFASLITAAREHFEKLTARAIFNQTWQRTLDNFPLWWTMSGTVTPGSRKTWPYFSDLYNRIVIDLPMPGFVSMVSLTYIANNGATVALLNQVNYADLVIGPAANQISSAASPFTAAQAGYSFTIYGGSGFNQGTYTIVSVAGGIATLSGPIGTVASSAGGGVMPGDFYVDANSEPARIIPTAGTWPNQATYLPGSVVVTWVAGTYGDGVAVNKCPMSIAQAIQLLVGHWYKNREDSGDRLSMIPNGFQSIVSDYAVTCVNYRPD